MAENNYPIPENPVFNMNIRALLDSDPASASATFNPLIERLIENLCALKLLLDGKVGAEAMQVALTDINNSLSGINTALAGKAAANHGHNAATAQAAGFMAAADKAKLDGITAKATANSASTTVPKALGAASAGSESGFARGDHVHPKPSAADIGAAASSHTHSYLPLTGGTLTGQLTCPRIDSTAMPNNANPGWIMCGNTNSGLNYYIAMDQLRSIINNRTNKVSEANAAYTTYMGRGIAVTTAVPSSMVNGTICGVY